MVMREFSDRQKFWVKRKPRKCKNCGSNRIADILFGLPAFTPELKAQLDNGKIVLGGCCLPGPDGLVWMCADCGVGYARQTEADDYGTAY